jgi:hypothetical protein
MVQARHIAAILVAACLSGCGYAMLDTDTTASFNSSSNSSSRPVPDPSLAPIAEGPATRVTANTGSLFARASAEASQPQQAPAAKPITVASTGDAVKPVEPPPAAEKVMIEPRGRAYLFRGVAGLIYSTGMDSLAARINRTGVTATVHTYLMWRAVVDDAVRDYRRDPEPITIIGHSMGGDSAVAFAETLNAADIPVSLLVTYDPTRIADDVPPNVERYINLFKSNNFMGGGDVVQGRRFHGHYASFNLKDHNEIIHINIEKADRIQEQLVTKIAQLVATPAGGEGEAVPLRLEVPAGASIELWDSGLPIPAHAGDTLQSLATTYHVPPWTLAQANRVSEHSPLTEGQRIIVPRHLVPMPTPAPVTSYAPTGR